jgi:hypothetical protein
LKTSRGECASDQIQLQNATISRLRQATVSEHSNRPSFDLMKQMSVFKNGIDRVNLTATLTNSA